MSARYKFNPPPNWPPPPKGWSPPHGWTPPAEWGTAPPNWPYWVKAGFWQTKYVLPTACLIGIVAIFLALTLPWGSGIDTSSDSYQIGYSSGEDMGKTFGLLSGDQLTEEGKESQCQRRMDIARYQGFELDGVSIPESEVDEDEYLAGCVAGMGDGINDPLGD